MDECNLSPKNKCIKTNNIDSHSQNGIYDNDILDKQLLMNN